MEQKIKHVVNRLNFAFYGFWLVSVCLFVLGELSLLPTGLWADNPTACFWAETVCILLTAAGIPFSLKLFSVVLKKRIDRLGISDALRKYEQWSYIRFVILGVIVWVDQCGYYFTLNNTGGLCALIGLTASLFCLPGETRLRSDLHVEKE